MTKSPSLARLGLDVLINVMAFMRPPDIIFLRQTCRAIHASSMHRIVWLYALEQMMEEHHIPKAIFPTASMDRRALEHTALSPAKFSLIIEKSTGDEIYPRSIRILPDHLSKQEMAKHGIKSFLRFTDILLGPGGRFLVTSLRVRAPVVKNLVQVWDIGVWGHEDRAKLLVQSILESKSIRLCSLSPIPDESGFYLVSEQTDNPQAIIVHKILALETFPTITRVNKQPIPSDLVSHSVSGTRLACVCESSTIIVWDFEAQSSARWDCHIEQDGELPFSIHLYDDNVLLYHSGRLMLWKIPEMRRDHKETSLQHRRLSTFSALFEDSDSDDSDSENETYLLPQSPWSCGHPGSEFLGIYRSPDFGLFRIQHLPSVPDANIPSILHSRMAIFKDLDLDDVAPGRDISSLQLCNRRLMVSALDSGTDRMYIQMLPILADGSKVESLPTKELVLRCRDLEPSLAQLCTATGRLCVVVGDTDIHILDYVQPPQRS